MYVWVHTFGTKENVFFRPRGESYCKHTSRRDEEREKWIKRIKLKLKCELFYKASVGLLLMLCLSIALLAFLRILPSIRFRKWHETCVEIQYFCRAKFNFFHHKLFFGFLSSLIEIIDMTCECRRLTCCAH